MFGYEDDAEITGYAIARLMIDRRFQGRGYGRAALHLIIEDLRGRPDCRCIYISFEPENETARHLYAAVGFVSEGRIIEGEVVYRLDV
jgi:diamine N-acetyltransferase